jgi:hypothetical protein
MLCLLPTVSFVKAQDTGRYRSPPAHPKSIQLIAGTQGIGAEFIYGLSPKLALRTGASFIPLTVNNAFPVSGVSSDNTLTAHFFNIHFLADFTPFENAPFIRVVGGAAYFIQAKGDFAVQPTGNYNYGDISLTPQEVGKLNMNVDWSGVAPYLGMGLARLFPRRRFNINLDLGSYYLSRPQTTVVGTGLLDGNSSQNAQFSKNMSGYRFLPVAQLNFSFKL